MTIVGIDIGGTNVIGGLLDAGALDGAPHDGALDAGAFGRACLAGAVRLRHEPLTPGADGLGPLRRRVHEVVARVAAGKNIEAVGISASGFMTADRSQITNATLQLRQAPLPAGMAEDLGVPVVMENDANCAAWAEYVTGPGAGRNPFVLLTLGTGVGGGIICDGQLIRGSHSQASELGHLPIDPAGPPCPCGGVGCLELYASGRALVREFAARRPGAGGTTIPHAGPFDRTGLADLEDAFAQALAAGERSAAQALAATAAAIARGILVLARTLDPELFALGGGLSAIGQPLLDAVREAIRATAGMTFPLSDTPVVLARHRNDAGALGAALLAADLAGLR
jgi:glucokinase